MKPPSPNLSYRTGRASKLIPLVAMSLLLLACAPGSNPATRDDGVAPPPAGPKTLFMATQGEPTSLVLYGRPAGSTTTCQS